MTDATLTRLQSALADRYAIQQELARGGMGQVFEARDLKHGRAVAIKVLDPELSAAIGPTRFRAEIETAARLAHPHIVPLFDSGEAEGLFYYVMPLVTGESLRKRLNRERQLPVEDAIRIAREVADALRYAHEQGLVHRDVKPENIILSGGHALVLDFGIARSTGAAPTAETRTIAAVGTPTYMSPEQSAGSSVDGRADQYALACVVYEMLAGQPPFGGPSGENIMHQHRTVAPRLVTALRPTAPVAMAQTLARALAKAPADRYPTMEAFSAALAAGGGSAPFAGRSAFASGAPAHLGRLMLAVLPLENLSPDPEQEFFTDGMTDELITHIGRLEPKRLGVIARTSAMRYKKSPKSAEEIGRELGVEYLLEGSVRRAGDRVRITTQLIQATDQSQVWAQTYDRRMADIFELQDEVAAAVAKALEVELVPVEPTGFGKGPGLRPDAMTAAADVRSNAPTKIPSTAPVVGKAYEAYLKGRFHWNRRTPDSLRLAIEWFERAIQEDPSFAPPYAGISDVLNVQVTYMLIPAEVAYPRAEQSARRSIELDPNIVEGHTSLASILTHCSRFEEGEEEFERALKLDPDYVPALYWGSIQHTALGRFDEALAMVNRAHRLDPLSVTVEIVTANVYWFARRGPEAIRHYRRALELEPKMMWVHHRLSLCLAAFGQFKEALAGIEALEPGLRATLEAISMRAYLLGRLGRRDEAIELVRELERRAKSEYVAWEHFVYANLGIDDREAILRVLEKKPRMGVIGRLLLAHDASFDPLRGDPRFREYLPERAGTPTELKPAG